MTAKEYIQDRLHRCPQPDFWWVNLPVSHEELGVNEVALMMEDYAAKKVKEDREATYAKRQKIQYMKKDDFINNGV